MSSFPDPRFTNVLQQVLNQCYVNFPHFQYPEKIVISDEIQPLMPLSNAGEWAIPGLRGTRKREGAHEARCPEKREKNHR
jgi:hypothetical protein